MSLDQAPRVRGSVFGRKSRAIDIVTPVAGQFDATLGLGVFGSGLHIVREPPDHRSAGAVHHDQSTQQHLELAGDGVEAFVERFRTVPALQEEPFSLAASAIGS